MHGTSALERPRGRRHPRRGAGPDAVPGGTRSPRGHDRLHAPFAFVDGTIDRVIVDVRGEHDVHHEREVLV
jgi:hypothetical protein